MNELYHVHGFKYVKREWKNGKWNYYYDNGNGKQTSLGVVNKISDWIGEDEKERYRRASQASTRASRNLHNSSNAARAAGSKYYDAKHAYERAKAKDTNEPSTQNGYDMLIARYKANMAQARKVETVTADNQATRYARDAMDDEFWAEMDYDKTIMSKIDRFLELFGKKKLSSINSVGHDYGTIRVVNPKYRDYADTLIKRYNDLDTLDAFARALGATPHR